MKKERLLPSREKSPTNIEVKWEAGDEKLGKMEYISCVMQLYWVSIGQAQLGLQWFDIKLVQKKRLDIKFCLCLINNYSYLEIFSWSISTTYQSMIHVVFHCLNSNFLSVLWFTFNISWCCSCAAQYRETNFIHYYILFGILGTLIAHLNSYNILLGWIARRIFEDTRVRWLEQ